MTPVEAFLTDLAKAENSVALVEHVASFVDGLVEAGAIADLDIALRQSDVAAIPSLALLALLVTSKPWADRLPSRAAFVERVRPQLEPFVGQFDRLQEFVT